MKPYNHYVTSVQTEKKHILFHYKITWSIDKNTSSSYIHLSLLCLVMMFRCYQSGSYFIGNFCYSSFLLITIKACFLLYYCLYILFVAYTLYKFVSGVSTPMNYLTKDNTIEKITKMTKKTLIIILIVFLIKLLYNTIHVIV